MLTVGVRDLRNQLSQYLQFVKGGEKIIITEHNKIIAEITPIEATEDTISVIEAKLLQLSKAGEVILAKRNKSCVNLPETKEKLDWESVYNDVRADR